MGTREQSCAVSASAGPLLFESKNGDEDIDSRFLELLRRVSAPTASTSKGERGAVQLHKLRLREADVAKVSPPSLLAAFGAHPLSQQCNRLVSSWS